MKDLEEEKRRTWRKKVTALFNPKDDLNASVARGYSEVMTLNLGCGPREVLGVSALENLGNRRALLFVQVWHCWKAEE